MQIGTASGNYPALMRSHFVSTDSSTGSAAGFIFVFLKFVEVLAIDMPHGAISALPLQALTLQVGAAL